MRIVVKKTIIFNIDKCLTMNIENKNNFETNHITIFQRLLVFSQK